MSKASKKIWIRPETLDRLRVYCGKGRTYDTALSELLDMAEVFDTDKEGGSDVQT